MGAVFGSSPILVNVLFLPQEVGLSTDHRESITELGL